MTVGIILLVLLVAMTIAALPAWHHSRFWGYYPCTGAGLIAAIVFVLVLMGRL